MPANSPHGKVAIVTGAYRDTWHYHGTKSSEYITQVTAVTALAIEYANSAGLDG